MARSKNGRVMKSLYRYTSAVAAALLAVVFAPGTAFSDSRAPKFNLESEPPIREGALGGFSSVIEKVSPSVVSVMSSRTVEVPSGPSYFQWDPSTGRLYQHRSSTPQRRSVPQPQGLGSGVIVTTDGYIVTNNHVVRGADEVKVAIGKRDEIYDASIVGTDESTDVAVLKIEAKNLPAATLAESSMLKAGDAVLAIGSPFGLPRTVTTGIVSALGRTNLGITGAAGYEDFIQTDASINPGNSGGALVDNRGRVVGINTAIFSQTGGNLGIGFAIPTELAMSVAEQLIEFGEVQRGFLGVVLGDITPELSKAMNTGRDGSIVHEVAKGSPAELAGFKPGDVITDYGADRVANSARLRLMVGATRPGTEIDFKVTREGKEISLTCKIGEQERSPSERSSRPLERWGNRDELIPGVSVTDLSDSLRSRLGLPRDVDGLLIEKVDPDSPAADAGLQAGELITEIDRQRITSYDDAVEAKENASTKGDVLLLRVLSEKGSRFVAVELS